MKRSLVGRLAAVVTTLLLAGASFGQQRAVPPPAAQNVPETGATTDHGQPVFQYFVVIGSTILILFVACKPSRKTQ